MKIKIAGARRVLLVLVAGASVFASPAYADDPAGVVTPPPATMATAPALARETREVHPASGPNLVMLGVGVVSFAFSFGAAAVAGATSSYGSDRRLLVPVLGPWLDLAERAGCPTGGPSCHAERTDRTSLVVDGAFQGLGALAIAAALAFAWPGDARVVSVGTAGHEVAIAPVGYPGGAGLAASGTY
jgi:hypothetical protein